MRRRAKNRRRGQRLLLVRRVTAASFGLAAVMLLLFGAFALAPLPLTDLPQASHIYDRNGNLVTQLFEQRRTTVALNNVPLHLQRAVLAVEDERFYDHFGVDLIAIARALSRNLARQKVVEGGSTITQQLAKNLFLTPEQTVRRKILELAITLRLEQNLAKDEILEQYLNTIYFGHGSYGVEEAARTYFGRSVTELTLAESAMLAGILRSPERLSPFKNYQAATDRQQVVLGKMLGLGFITEGQYSHAKTDPVNLAEPRSFVHNSPYFVQMVIDELSEVLPDAVSSLYRGGLRIFTTLDLQHQSAAERAINAVSVISRDERGVEQPQLAIVALDPGSGGISAVVGGRDWRETQFNRAVQARRQPGSAFKPFVYVSAIDQGFIPTSRQMCEPVHFPTGRPGQLYSPTDHGSSPYHYRPMTMREALSISDNVVAVRWIHEITPATVIEYVRKMGVASPMEAHLALALGTSEVSPLEMARAYAVFANGGYRVDPHTILEVQLDDGTVLFQRSSEPVRVLRPEVAYIVTDLLTSVMSRGGTGHSVGRMLGRPAAGKTGTTEGLLDAWFVGYTPELVCSVFIGYDGPRRALPGTGAAVAGPVWARFMSEALAGTPVSQFARPERIRELAVCSETGLLANPTCAHSLEVFALPLIPVMSCPILHDHFVPDAEQDEEVPSNLGHLHEANNNNTD